MKSLLLSIFIAAFVIGCGGAKGGISSGSGGESSAKLGRIDEGSRCKTDGRRESLVDLNQDGIPDVRKVYLEKNDEQILVCREADLNFDGTKDVYMFFDQNGQITKDEVDLDHNGTIDIISTYAKGKVIKQEIDTNSDGVVDRLRYLEQDIPIRVEGDTDGDQRIDYWEYYEAGKLIRIGVDEDGDGKADSWSRDEETEAAALGGGEEEEEEDTDEETGETEEGDTAEEESTEEDA